MSDQTLSGIKKLGGSQYLATFGEGPSFVEFRMWVDGDEIPVLHCEERFYEYSLFSSDSVGLILDAVMRFHQASSVPFPSLPRESRGASSLEATGDHARPASPLGRVGPGPSVTSGAGRCP